MLQLFVFVVQERCGAQNFGEFNYHTNIATVYHLRTHICTLKHKQAKHDKYIKQTSKGLLARNIYVQNKCKYVLSVSV